MSRCPKFTFQVSIMWKFLAKHIRTKVSFKITIRKRHVYIDNRWPWKWNQFFYLGFSGDERSKIIFLPSFQLVTRLNSQNRNETCLLMNSDAWICIRILAFTIGIIEVSTSRKWSFYFISVPFTITDLQPLYSHYYITRWAKWSDVKNVIFSFSKCEKWKSAET